MDKRYRVTLKEPTFGMAIERSTLLASAEELTRFTEAVADGALVSMGIKVSFDVRTLDAKEAQATIAGS